MNPFFSKTFDPSAYQTEEDIINFFQQNQITMGYALTGSHCTLAESVREMAVLRDLGIKLTAIISFSVKNYDTKFGNAADWRQKLIEASENPKIIDTIMDAEPIGPQSLFDVVIIAPCSGNSLAKLANGIADTPVLMAAKAHLRNLKPLVIFTSSNDGLGVNFANIGRLMNYKNVYFVPFGQDNPIAKANSLMGDFKKLPQTVIHALAGKQIQPLLLQYDK